MHSSQSAKRTGGETCGRDGDALERKGQPRSSDNWNYVNLPLLLVLLAANLLELQLEVALSVVLAVNFK